MSMPSLKALEKTLKSYSLDVEYWENDCGEGHLMQGNRDYLEQWKGLLSSKQLTELVAVDTKAKTLLDNHRGEETIDVWNLRNTVDTAFGKQLKAA